MMVRFIALVVLLNTQTLEPYVHQLDDTYSDPYSCMSALAPIAKYADTNKRADMVVQLICLPVEINPPL